MHYKNRLSANFIKSWSSKLILAGSDFVLFNCGPLVAALLVHLLFKNLFAYIPIAEIPSRFTAHVFLSIACVGWFWFRLRHYTYRKTFWFELKEILRTVLIFSVIDLAIVAFSKWHLSRYVWVFTWTSTLILLPIGRFAIKKALARVGLWKKQSIIIGSGKNAIDAFHALKNEKNMGFDVQYFFSCDATCQHDLLGVPIIDDEALVWQKTHPSDTQYFIALEYEQERQRDYWIKALATRRCRAISVIPTTRGIPLNSTDMSFIFSHEVLILRINNNLTKYSARILKRTFDLIGSSIILLLLSPILLCLTFAIMRDGGPPVYGHERIGRNGEKFKCLKFRSMVVNSKAVLAEILERDPHARAEWERDFKLRNDPRVTRIGSILRRTSIDELPQLINVLRGDMSLVGPRPVVEEELERYGENVDYYLLAKPGMTGLWQVSGRNDVDYDTRVYFDAWYVKNWSLWNDIAILFKTIAVVLKRNGAY